MVRPAVGPRECVTMPSLYVRRSGLCCAISWFSLLLCYAFQKPLPGGKSFIRANCTKQNHGITYCRSFGYGKAKCLATFFIISCRFREYLRYCTIQSRSGHVGHPLSI